MQQKVLGIDLGKGGFVLADPSGSIVHEITYHHPDWWSHFLPHVAPRAIVCAEPSGWHLLSPIAGVLAKYQPTAELWLVPHRTSAAVRETHVSTAKTDALDAQALALIASWIANGDPPRNVRLFDPAASAAVMQLRLLMNQHRRLTKTSTRLLNQIDALAHGILPAFAQFKGSYLTAVLDGFVTPDEIATAIDHRDGIYADGRTRRWAVRLVANAPDLAVPSAMRDAITSLVEQQAAIEATTATVQRSIHNLIHLKPFLDVTAAWQTVPGAGDNYIAALHVASDAAAHQLEADDFRAMLGHAPITRQSGNNEHLPSKANRKGYRPALDALHLWTMLLLQEAQRPNPVAAYFDSHAHVNKRLNAARRKFAGILSGIARDPAGVCLWNPQEGGGVAS